MGFENASRNPIFRYNTGNIVDVSTLKSTPVELTQYGVNVEFSILDGGYYSETNIKEHYSETNIKELYNSNIRFVTRLNSNRKL
ncbi:hypothetical protein FACS1894152_7300 [Bacilli bacterium]|nr:hypothetical protein FACS1894152_7300 [Bacilli bacterium]